MKQQGTLISGRQSRPTEGHHVEKLDQTATWSQIWRMTKVRYTKLAYK